jgi:FkbM family methyltransferase
VGVTVDKWDWAKFRGSEAGLKWGRKDLGNVDEALKVTKGRTSVVQAGGNLGIFPKYLSRFFKRVYAFEPEPELFEMMCANAPERNIVKFQAALGCERGLVGISRVRRQNDGGTAHEGIAHVSGKGAIPTLKIDDLGLDSCDLICLDIEGYELYALRGADETIRKFRPTILCEINKSLDSMKEIVADDVRTNIRMRDYEFVMRVRSDELYVPRERAVGHT